MQDIRELDNRGIPGGFIASSVFETAARTRGAAIGFHPNKVFVPHPIQDRTDEEMQALADNAIDEILGMVVAS